MWTILVFTMPMEWFREHLGDIFVPLYVGTAFYSIVVSYIIYLLINYLWIRSVRQEKKDKKTRRQRDGNNKESD
jgi:uncharacterized protein (DUF2062 family)